MLDTAYKFFEPYIDKAKTQWIGLLVGIAMTLLAAWYFCYDELQDFRNLGSLVGHYRMEIDKRNLSKHIQVSSNEFYMEFSMQKYRIINRIYDDSQKVWIGGDTVSTYPAFIFNGGTYHNYRVGRSITVPCTYYIYTATLREIEYENDDTIAVFDVFRREYPSITKKDSK